MKRTYPKNLFPGYKFLTRHQQSAIIPIVGGAAALKGFWQTISLKAIYNDWASETPSALFTITEGLLQATFSGLGHDVPWLFVRNFAMDAAAAVDMKWTDTFDAYYEQEGTGIVICISLRVLLEVSRNVMEVA